MKNFDSGIAETIQGYQGYEIVLYMDSQRKSRIWKKFERGKAKNN